MDAIISTQEMIEDARARRQFNTQEFQCEKCDYKSGSKTLLKKHNTESHETTMRKRFSCESCPFKTTNESSLKIHTEATHNKTKTKKVITSKSKRIHCNDCKKKFNKEETFKKHIENCQKITYQTITRNETGRSNEIKQNYIQENEENSGANLNIRKSEP